MPSADRDLLMFLASSSTAPSAPVLLTLRGDPGQRESKRERERGRERERERETEGDGDRGRDRENV